MVHIVAKMLCRTHHGQYLLYDALVLGKYLFQTVGLKLVACNDIEILSKRKSPQVIAFNDAVKIWDLVYQPHNARPGEDDFQLGITVVALT